MNHKIKRILIATLTLSLLTMPAVVSAKDGVKSSETEHASTTVSSTSPSPTPSTKAEDKAKANDDKAQHAEAELKDQLEQMKQQRQATVEAVKTDLRVKLDDSKKKICENHQSTINSLMDDMKQRRQTAFTHITNVATAVEDFYTKQQLTVSNYSDLVAAIEAAKAAAQTAMDTQQAAPQLDCNGDHPRADVADFKEKRADSIDAMQTYRNAVRQLLNAVKTVADAAKTTEAN